MNAQDTPSWRDRLGLSYDPSSYQCAIFDFIATGRGHGVVEAVAGSGKTTTIVSAAKLLAGDGLFVAFNKSIASLLSTRLKGTKMAASTVHSHGFAAVRNGVRGRVKVDGAKYTERIDMIRGIALDEGVLALGRDNERPLTSAELRAIDDDGFPRPQISKLLHLARYELLDPSDDGFAHAAVDLARHHNIEIAGVAEIVIECVRKLMIWGWDHPEVIDYTDMIWLPIVNGYALAKYSHVFVDECQDLNKAQLEVIMRSVRPGGRMLFVGDPKQAIYGFAGADAESFRRIVELTGATVLPLSVCYRCPASVLELAREFCPQIEAREGAPDGVVRTCKRDDFVADAREGDMVLCRLNAPLLGLCFALIAEGVSAAVRGREIGKGLCKVVTRCAKRLHDFADFGMSLETWEDKEISTARLRYRDPDALAQRIENIGDQGECIRIILARSGARSASELNRAIDDLFADDNPSVVLSSVHKAKGLEADRVFVAKPERLGVARPGAQPWMVDQEENLLYVAITRAMVEYVEIIDTEAA